VTEISLVILAAGMGSRYGGLKQIDPVGPHGELLIEYSIVDALSVGIEHIAFVIQQSQEETFRNILGAKIANRCRVSFVHQELTDLPAGFSCPPERQKPWGTGHAVLSCRHVVQGPFAVINADDFYGRPSYAALAAHLGRADGARPTYALVGFDVKKTVTEHGTVSPYREGFAESMSMASCLVSMREQRSVCKTARWFSGMRLASRTACLNRPLPR